MKIYQELHVEPMWYDQREHYETEFAPGEIPQETGFETKRLVQNPIGNIWNK